MRNNRNYVVDLRTCIKRFYVCEKLIKDWLKFAGRNKMEIFSYLNPKGDESLDLPRHPYEDYTAEEKTIFRQCFEVPMKIPKDLNIRISVKDFLKQLADRRDFMRECAGMTANSRFRGVQYRSKNRKKRFKK